MSALEDGCSCGETIDGGPALHMNHHAAIAIIARIVEVAARLCYEHERRCSEWIDVGGEA